MQHMWMHKASFLSRQTAMPFYRHSTCLFDNLLGQYSSSTDCFIILREQGLSYRNHMLRQTNAHLSGKSIDNRHSPKLLICI